jgi:hypothetical protein
MKQRGTLTVVRENDLTQAHTGVDCVVPPGYTLWFHVPMGTDGYPLPGEYQWEVIPSPGFRNRLLRWWDKLQHGKP